MSDSGARGYTFSTLNLPDRPVAAKTGTTSDFRDAWTLGYTPSLAAGVWTGNNDNHEMHNQAAGLVIATPIWNEFMRRATEGSPAEEFQNIEEPDTNKPVLRGSIGTTEVKKVDKITQKAIPDECIDTYPTKYIIEKEFKQVHSILYYVDKDDPRGPAPENPENDSMFSSWEGAVHGFAQSNPTEYLTEEMEYEDCNLRDVEDPPVVSISYPQSGEKYNVSTFSIMLSASASQEASLEKVEYYIDNNLIDVATSSPWQSNYSASGLTVGNHTLKAIAYDDFGNSGSDSVSFKFSSSDNKKEDDKKNNEEKNKND